MTLVGQNLLLKVSASLCFGKSETSRHKLKIYSDEVEKIPRRGKTPGRKCAKQSYIIEDDNDIDNDNDGKVGT